MKTIRFGLTAAALLIVAAAPLAAQGGQRGPMGQGQLNALDIILDNKADLALTDEQVAKLTELNQKLAETNKPHLEEVQKLRGQGRPASREEGQQRMQAMRPHMQAIGENNRKAHQEAEALLTDEQKTKVRDLVEKVREEMRRRRPGGPPARR